MTKTDFAKEALLEAVAKLQEQKELAASVGPDWYEPGRMENLDQYLGVYDESSRTITLRTESKGLRYDERTPRLDYLSAGDPVRLEREPDKREISTSSLVESGASAPSARKCTAVR